MKQQTLPNQQTAYQLGRTVQSDDIDHDIAEAMRLYLLQDLGLDNDFANARAEKELLRSIPGSVARLLADAGIEVAFKEVLDLGAGLGGMSEELILRGAKVTAVEPGAAWAALTHRRVGRHSGKFKMIHAFGEAIPLPSESIDVIVSLQVLEHVQSPEKVLSEAWRVLRPGGHFYLACENYLAFREGHYQVPWFPLLPKPIAQIYLRLLGRSPKFLKEAVTYITHPGVLRRCRHLGFVRLRDKEILDSLRLKTGVKWDFLRLLAFFTKGRGPLWLEWGTHVFKFGISELFQKPEKTADSIHLTD